jgi:hypothetical protein
MKQLLIFISVMCSMNISAQVTIGKIADPHEAAVLDLSQKETSAPERGLLMPRVPLTGLTPFQLPTTVADTPEKATGMVVYNLAENAFVCPGLYVWDGSTWNRLMGEVCPPYVYIPPAIQTCMADYYPHNPTQYIDIEVDADGAGGGTDLTILRFLTYNLGANPNLSPKEQMAYSKRDVTDVSVYGGLYQWGRKDAEHSQRCDNASPNTNYFTDNLYSTYNPVTDTKFVYGAHNWLNPATNQAIFWGNGKGLADQTTPPTSGENIHNPCPPGFRVPTQHEWALLGNEGGSSTNTSSDYFSTDGGVNGTTGSLTNPVVWVPVADGVASTSWNSGMLCGYALYKKSVWEGALAGWSNNAAGQNLTETAAPDPLMFLPAAGYRPTSTQLFSPWNYGFYWSSTTSTTDNVSYATTFISSNVYADTEDFYRADGFSVRCVSE